VVTAFKYFGNHVGLFLWCTRPITSDIDVAAGNEYDSGMINHTPQPAGQTPPQTDEERQAAVQQAMGRMIHELSLNIFTRVAAQQIAKLGETIEDESYRAMAMAAQRAAREYFVGVGAMHKASPIAQP
jgi:HAMP domain-containing protein